MKALVQRVSRASVIVEGAVIGAIGRGLLVFVGIAEQDTEQQASQLARKVTQLRIFNDSEGKMNLNVLETAGELLIVSQFTLYGDTSRGHRPSYSQAARPERARDLYELFIDWCRRSGVSVSTGKFQAHMDVSLVNEGPVTLMCTSEL
jgi:D-tyrosyl-tRNA(Tyr) deacylase